MGVRPVCSVTHFKEEKKGKRKKLKNVQCDLTSTHCVSQHISCGLYQQAAPPRLEGVGGAIITARANSLTTDCGSRRRGGHVGSPPASTGMLAQGVKGESVYNCSALFPSRGAVIHREAVPLVNSRKGQ